MMEDFSCYHGRFLWLLCQNSNTTNYKADLLQSGAQAHLQSHRRSVISHALQKKKSKTKVISVYLQMFCIPQVENGPQRRAENESSRSGADGAGASSVAVRQSPSDPNQKLRSLSSSLGRYHELRRDRGRWVGYVHEAGGINGANLQERCRGSKRGQPPGELKERRVTVRRRRRHC